MNPLSVDHCMVRSWAIVPPVAITSYALHYVGRVVRVSRVKPDRKTSAPNETQKK